jgi:predicted RNA binding protein YcfA (HicA-like mRNA interferase family)
MKVGDVLRMLHNDGWYLVSTRGSHRQLKHPTKAAGSPFQGSPAMTWHRER